MIYDKYAVVFWFMVLSACSNSDVAPYTYTHPIPFAPENYICYRAPQPPVIDGILEEEAWGQVQWSGLFVDIEGDLKPKPKQDTRMKMMWDSTNLYIAAIMYDDHIWATLKQRDTIIFQNNDIEVFIDPDGDTHNYLELEINALNTVWDLMLERPYREDSLPKVHDEWNIENLQTAVYIEGTLNDPSDRDSFWISEMAIPIEAITVYNPPQGEKFRFGNSPRHGDQWRINFSRVAWHIEVIDGRYVKKKDMASDTVPYDPQENWVWSPSGRVNMHEPETWGYLQFSENMAGQKEDQFIYHEEEEIKWGLRQLYFQQEKCNEARGSYSCDTSLFTIPKITIGSYSFSPVFICEDDYYTISAPNISNTGSWKIRQDGKIWLE